MWLGATVTALGKTQGKAAIGAAVGILLAAGADPAAVAAVQAAGQVWGTWAGSIGRSVAEESRATGWTAKSLAVGIAAAAVPAGVVGAASVGTADGVLMTLSALNCVTVAVEMVLAEMVTVHRGMALSGVSQALLWLRAGALVGLIWFGLPALESYFVAGILQEATMIVLFARLLLR